MFLDKMVSVIIPAYNAALYLEKCVCSVIEQDYKAIEIIVINDGSKDETLSIGEKLKNTDTRIKVINQINKGSSAARNAGLKACNGEYVFFLDSDDWIDKNCISTLVSTISRDNTDIVFFDYYKCFIDREIEHHIYNENFVYNKNEDCKHSLWDMRTITVWGKLYTRKCIADELYDEKMRTAEDVDFNYRVYSRVNKAVFINKCLLHYRILEQSAIHGYDAKVREKFDYPIKRIASYMKNGDSNNKKAYYSFVAIAYIVICQNGVVLNSNLSYKEKNMQIREISCESWAKDLFLNTKYISIPLSRRLIIYCSRIGLFSAMLIAGNIRRRWKK